MDSAILSRFGTKKYFPSPSKEQFVDLFKNRLAEFEKEGVVETGFFKKYEDRLGKLAQKMEEGHASYRTYWLGVEEQVQNVAASRFSRDNLTGDARKIIIDDFEQAVEKCAKEENWGVKLEDKGVTLEDYIQATLGILSKNETGA